MKTTYKDFLILEHTKQLKEIVKKWINKYSFDIPDDFWNVLEETYINNNTYMINAYYWIVTGEPLTLDFLKKIGEIMKKKKESYNDVIKNITKKDGISKYLSDNKDIKTSLDIVVPSDLDCLELLVQEKDYSVYKIKYDDEYTIRNLYTYLIEYLAGQDLEYDNITKDDDGYQDELNYLIDDYMEDITLLDINHPDVYEHIDEYISNNISEDKFKKVEKVRNEIRKLLNSQLGEKTNPWCLLANDENNNLCMSSTYFWYMIYTGVDKLIAFKNNKVISFCASKFDVDVNTWWDLQDEERYYIYSDENETAYYNPYKNRIEIDYYNN